MTAKSKGGILIIEQLWMYEKQKAMTRLGLDPRTLSVLTIRDNQLHHPAN